MKSGPRVAFLLLLLTGAVAVKGSDLPGSVGDEDHFASAVPRVQRGIGYALLDTLRGRGDPKPSKPPAGSDFGFNLEDALKPAQKPTDKPGAGDCQLNVVQKLNAVIENQNQQLRMLQLMARSSRFNDRRMR